MELKPGDVVILKSGGHPVTVAEVNDDTVECLWMGGEGDLFRETLPKAVLPRLALAGTLIRAGIRSPPRCRPPASR